MKELLEKIDAAVAAFKADALNHKMEIKLLELVPENHH